MPVCISKFLRLITILFAVQHTAVLAQSVNIRQPFTDTFLCVNTNFTVYYDVTGPFIPGNMFIVQLSNAAGDFTWPIDLDTLAAVDSGSITTTVPYIIPPGPGYRIRIVATMPTDTSADNGKDISIGHPPAVVISNNSPVCENDSAAIAYLNPSPGVTYVWTGPALAFPYINFPLIEIKKITLSQAGTYNLKATLDGFPGCVVDIPVNVAVKPRPAKPDATSNSPVCSYDTLQLMATTATAGAGFLWDGPGFSSTLQNPEIQNITQAQAGLYTVSAIYDDCPSLQKDSVWVNVTRLPSITIAANNPACEKDTLIVSAADTSLLTTYNWSGPNGLNINNRSFSIAGIGFSDSGMYYIEATYLGCTGKDSINVKVKPLPPLPVLSSNSPVCEGDTLFINSVSIGLPGPSYNWQGPGGFTSDKPGAAIPNAQEKSAGSYVLDVNLNGCITSDTLDITVKPRPFVTASSNSPVVEKRSLQLFANSQIPGTSFSWIGPNGFTSTEQNPVITPANDTAIGMYYVIASFDGCSASDSVDVLVSDSIKITIVDLYPNPNDGSFTLKGRIPADQEMPVEIWNTGTGILVYHDTITSLHNRFIKKISLPGHLAGGVYQLRIEVDGKKKYYRFSLVR